MTQKRGLGRGLGALIPGGSPNPVTAAPTSTSAADHAEDRNGGLAADDGATEAAHPADAAAVDVSAPDGGDTSPTAPASDASPASKARTRSHPRTTPDPGEPGAARRPVDMFFSGEAAASRSANRRDTAPRDLAESMAREAAEKRTKSRSGGRTAKKSARRTAQDPPAVEVEAVTPEPAAAPSADDIPRTNPVESVQTGPAELDQVENTPEVPHKDLPAASDATGADLDSVGELVAVPGAEFAEVPIAEIRENPRNPRSQFDEDALDELAYSLREVGVLQPVVVRPIAATDQGESFELVMGERRWRAAQRAGLTSIPAIIRETSDDDLLRDALLENLHRSELNPLEEAAAYQQLLEDFGCTQDELSQRIGRSRPQISNTLRLMKLPPLVQRRLASGALSAGHARALLGIDQPEMMEELAQRIVAEGLSVREVERLVSRGLEPGRSTSSARRTSYHPRVVDLTGKLSNRLEAPVRIDVGKRKGKITLEFTTLEDLERLIDRMGLEVDARDLAGES